MPLDGAHERLRMRDVEWVQQKAIERGGEQSSSAEAEGKQQHDREVGCAICGA